MARARKKDDNSGSFMVVAAFLCAIPLLIFGAIRYFRLRRYLKFSDTQRVFDIGVTMTYPITFGAVVIFTFLFMFTMVPAVIERVNPAPSTITQTVNSTSSTSELTSPAGGSSATQQKPSPFGMAVLLTGTFVFVLVVTIAGITCTKLFAADLIGCLVIPSQGIAVVPRGFNDFVLEDYLTGRFLWKVGEMNELPLAQIRTLTRQAGTQLHIHGDFGSRSVRFSNKQKRDEYLSALLHNTRSRMNREIE